MPLAVQAFLMEQSPYFVHTQSDVTGSRNSACRVGEFWSDTYRYTSTCPLFSLYAPPMPLAPAESPAPAASAPSLEPAVFPPPALLAPPAASVLPVPAVFPPPALLAPPAASVLPVPAAFPAPAWLALPAE